MLFDLTVFDEYKRAVNGADIHGDGQGAAQLAQPRAGAAQVDDHVPQALRQMEGQCQHDQTVEDRHAGTRQARHEVVVGANLQLAVRRRRRLEALRGDEAADGQVEYVDEDEDPLSIFKLNRIGALYLYMEQIMRHGAGMFTL